jgi:hypothetical protein
MVSKAGSDTTWVVRVCICNLFRQAVHTCSKCFQESGLCSYVQVELYTTWSADCAQLAGIFAGLSER